MLERLFSIQRDKILSNDVGKLTATELRGSVDMPFRIILVAYSAEV